MKENPTYAAPDLETADPETDRQHAPARFAVHVIAGSSARGLEVRAYRD